MKINGLIFDLDGTMLDSMGVWNHLGECYLRGKGVSEIPGNLNEILRPMSLSQAAEYFIRRFYLRLSAGQIVSEINGMIEYEYKYRIGLKDGVRAFLMENRNLKMCVATATDRYLAESALKRLGADAFFSFIITSAEIGGSKQSPEIYLMAAKRLGLPVSEIVVFEDALHAVKTAVKAGFYTVGVYEAAFERDQAKIKKAADNYVKNLCEFKIR